ncbi:hypothetical protein P7K49_012382 [Saguinus oedipus]|uniref:2-oxo-4-hydroxy-4-carboxy-5-ureidoimidazoline decarboxylase n=1 Tax=Saguinus oedipus TaxID=9490 RepID=A0ABQ9VU24_SAGOE|nr:hypothetical protein P7K49_012382 [Saguinus oedipus]
MDIEKVNSMDFGEFVDVFGNVIERCPLIAAAVWSQRPFLDLEDLQKHFFAFIDALPRSGLVRESQALAWLWSDMGWKNELAKPRGKGNRPTFVPKRASFDWTSKESEFIQIITSLRGGGEEEADSISLEKEKEVIDFFWGEREEMRHFWV